MLVVNNIRRSFGPKEILRGVSFTLADRSLTGLIGPSGGGKSLLLKILAHTCRCDSGSVSLGSRNTTDIAFMFQEGALFDSLSVYDNVAFPLVGGAVPTSHVSQCNRNEVCRQVSEILSRVGLSRHAHKMPGQLSGGMRRRVSLARALVGRPKVLLLDDPTSGLDPIASSVIMDLINEIHHEYNPITLIVSHDLRRLLPSVDAILTLFDGKITFHGTLPELVATACPRIRGFVSCRFDLDPQESLPHEEQPN